MENLKNLSMSESNMKMIGEAILLASIQFSIGSVEMSSKFSVKNFLIQIKYEFDLSKNPGNTVEREGFEPSEPFNGFTRFPGVPIQPLLHLSYIVVLI